MSELLIERVEKEDIRPPKLQAGGTSIVLQRHGAYQRDKAAENAGSITDASAYETGEAFFTGLLDQEAENSPQAMVLFLSSDTQYAAKGYRSMETTDLALQAATQTMKARHIDPAERIINLHPDFHINRFEPLGKDIRPVSRLREPQLFDESNAYTQHLLDTYGDRESGDLSTAAWAAHEADTERTVREQAGAEGIQDVIARTKAALRSFELYAQRFHAANPNTHLVIWAGTHYDTISPLVKDATGAPLDQYIPVEHGSGVVIEIPPTGDEAVLRAQNQEAKLKLGGQAIK